MVIWYVINRFFLIENHGRNFEEKFLSNQTEILINKDHIKQFTIIAWEQINWELCLTINSILKNHFLLNKPNQILCFISRIINQKKQYNVEKKNKDFHYQLFVSGFIVEMVLGIYIQHICHYKHSLRLAPHIGFLGDSWLDMLFYKLLDIWKVCYQLLDRMTSYLFYEVCMFDHESSIQIKKRQSEIKLKINALWSNDFLEKEKQIVWIIKTNFIILTEVLLIEYLLW